MTNPQPLADAEIEDFRKTKHIMDGQSVGRRYVDYIERSLATIDALKAELDRVPGVPACGCYRIAENNFAHADDCEYARPIEDRLTLETLGQANATTWVTTNFLAEASAEIKALKAEVEHTNSHIVKWWAASIAAVADAALVSHKEYDLHYVEQWILKGLTEPKAKLDEVREWVAEYGMCSVCSGTNADECRHWKKVLDED